MKKCVVTRHDITKYHIGEEGGLKSAKRMIAYFIDGRFFNEPWRIGGEDAVSGQNVNLVRATLLQGHGSIDKRLRKKFKFQSKTLFELETFALYNVRSF